MLEKQPCTDIDDVEHSLGEMVEDDLLQLVVPNKLLQFMQNILKTMFYPLVATNFIVPFWMILLI